MNYVVDKGIRSLPESSWRPILQRSIDAFYEGRHAEGIAACLTLLQATGLPTEVRELTYRNQTFYARPLPEIVPGATWRPLNVQHAEGWALRDPSPVAAANRIQVLLRATPTVTRATASDDLALAENPDGLERILLRDENHDGPRLTDARPFMFRDHLHVAAIERTAETESSRGVVATLSPAGLGSPHHLGPRAGHFQQGWSPVVTAEAPHLVAWWEPTEIFRLDQETGEFTRVALRMAPHIAERFQSGSPGVPIPGGYLFLVNDPVRFDADPHFSLCRFLRIDNGFQITAISPHFSLTERGRDRATGLARQGDRLIAGFMVDGTTPLLATMDLESVLTTLMPVAAPAQHRLLRRLTRKAHDRCRNL